jgi:hypothetical protein
MYKTSVDHRKQRIKRFQTRWPAWLGLIAVSLLYEALPTSLYWGPRGLMIGLVAALIVLMIIMYWSDNSRIARILGLSVNILITAYMVISVNRIVIAVLQGNIAPAHLLLSSMVLWGTNIFVFALWYWNLDAGGPLKRELTPGHKISAFLFPQTQLCFYQNDNLPKTLVNWEPGFIDYLFLAFNTSTAFSPTDTAVITRWAKIMFMLQSLISLTIVIMLAARAINILSPG